MKFETIEEDLIQLALAGNFDVITHGVNCFCTQGAGIAAQMAKHFNTDNTVIFELEKPNTKGNYNKLGQIEWAMWDYKTGKLVPHYSLFRKLSDPKLFIVNCYTQYNYGKNHVDGVSNPLDYEALTLCMRKLNYEFKSKHIGLPMIGAGLAGGDWNRIEQILKQELKDCDVTIVKYKK